MKILVVDDERAVRDSLRRALELEGYEIDLAENGREALDRLDSEPEPDALVLDVLMPGVDGLEVCRTLRRKGSRLPVLMLTARTQVDDRVEGLDAGADDYLTKPFALEELLALFMLNPRQVLTRSVIFERVWGYDFGFGSNSLDVYIGYLRRKTEAGAKPRLIHTVRGVGYAL